MSDDWAITGVGLVAAPGDTAADLHRALCRGAPLWSDVAQDGAEDGTAAVRPAAPIDGFDARNYLQRRGLRDLSRTSQLACAAAARLATALEGVPASEIGVVLGTGWGGLRSIVDFEWETCTEQVRFVNPLLFAETVSNVPAGQVSIHFGWSACNLTVSGGAASGLQAIRQGVDLLEEGRAPVIVAGGADEINVAALRVLQADGAAARADSLPFGRGRSGLIGGEGACLMVLESSGHARTRRARPLARLRAAVSRCCAAEVPGDGAPAAEIAALLRELLDRGGVAAGEVDLVAASADGSAAGDREEAGGIHAVFGGGAEAPCVFAPKGILGETWGAAGPLAAAAAVESMRAGLAPCRPRRAAPDPALPALNLPPEPCERRVRHAVVLARTATGHLCALLLAPGEGGGAD